MLPLVTVVIPVLEKDDTKVFLHSDEHLESPSSRLGAHVEQVLLGHSESLDQGFEIALVGLPDVPLVIADGRVGCDRLGR